MGSDCFNSSSTTRERRANRPAVFIDAVAPAEGVTMYFSRRHFGHELFPELRDYVAENYSLLASVEGIRLYPRRELMLAKAATLPR